MENKSLSGAQKAALLLIALKADTAAEIFKHLDPQLVENISAEITRAKNIPNKTVESVLEEFYTKIVSKEYGVNGGYDYAKTLLEKSLGKEKAKEISEKVKTIPESKGFDVLKKADSSQLVTFLNKEHPQTIALILSHLNPEQTATVLKELPEDVRNDVVFRIATLGKISPETLKQIEKVIGEMAGFTISQSLSQIGGAKSLANILNKANNSLSKEIMEKIEAMDQQLALEVKRLMFLFEDIINIQDKDIQRLLRDIDRKDLALSLKIADDKLKEKIYKNMSERAADLLKEEIEFMGMVKLRDVEAAQARIIEVLKSLEEAGEIVLNMGGGSEDIYV